MNIVVIVQARTGSTRLPGKIMKKILGKTILELQMERMLRAKLPTHVVVATTTNKEDNDIVNLCINSGFLVTRGHPTDLLDRHYKTAVEFEADIVVKIPSDCPLIDPKIIDRVIGYYLMKKNIYDFVSNLHPPTYPDGNDVEVMSSTILMNTWKEAEKPYELEHTTPFIWDNPQRFRIGNVAWETGLDFSMKYRFTLDYMEDFEFIRTIYEELYHIKSDFDLNDIIKLLYRKQDIKKINEKYNGVNWYRNYKKSLNTINNSMIKDFA
jgi:spore coat polysaccharide biosynthesis protein SpsF